MLDHISDTQMEVFCARASDDRDSAAMTEHLAACAACRRLFQEALKRERGHPPISLSLFAADWFRNEHLDSEQLESLAENRLDDEETQVINLHLYTCEVCREDVHSYLEFKKTTDRELGVRSTSELRGGQSEKPSAPVTQSGGHWNPVLTIGILLIIGLAILAATLFSSGGASERQDRIAGSLEKIAAASTPLPQASMPSAATQSPVDSEEAILKDGERIIRFNDSGIVSGLETYPAGVQQAITDALMAGTIKKSVGLNELVSGSDMKSSLALSYPKRVVTVEDRPTFRWAPLDDASGYQVRIGDLQGNDVADSGRLPFNITQWKPSMPLKRGIVYTWAVIAVVNGEEVASPAPSDVEVRFKVLEREKLGELAALKNQLQSHLALGLFYAREGVLIEARREFQLLSNDNPNSQTVTKLLQRSQSLK